MFCSCFFLDRGLASEAFIFTFARYCRWTALSLRDAITNEEAQLGHEFGVYLQTAPRAVFSHDANIRRIDAGTEEGA